jgi:hypothetical protein
LAVARIPIEENFFPLRDRSIDYKITGFNVPKGSWDGRVIDKIAPIAPRLNRMD